MKKPKTQEAEKPKEESRDPSPHEPLASASGRQFEATKAIAEDIMTRYRNALRDLAKGPDD